MAVYWSGTEFAPNPNNAWNFNTDNGNQNNDNKDKLWQSLWRGHDWLAVYFRWDAAG